MKCQICKNKTDLDSSYGLSDFIVCRDCHKFLVGSNPTDERFAIVDQFIFNCGKLRRHKKGRK